MATVTAASHSDSPALISPSESQGESVLFAERSISCSSELANSGLIEPGSRWELVDTVQRPVQSHSPSPPEIVPPSSSQLFAPGEPITHHTTPPSVEPTASASEAEPASTSIWHPDPNVALSPPTVPVSLRQVWDYSVDELYGESAGSTASTSARKVDDDRITPGRKPMGLEMDHQLRHSAADPDVLDPLPLELPRDIFASTSRPSAPAAPPSDSLSSPRSNSKEDASLPYTSEPMQVTSMITALRGTVASAYRAASQLLLPWNWRTTKFSAGRIGAMLGLLGAVSVAIAVGRA